MTKRKNETEVEKLARQAKDREHKRRKFSSETEEEKLARQAKQREKRRQKQVSETEEEKIARQAKQREYQNRSKKRKSEASRAARRKQDALQHQHKRASESKIESISRKSKDARRYRERQAKQREQRRQKQVSEAEEETLAQQAVQREYQHQSKKRKSEASRTARRKQDALQHRRKRASESEMASTSRKSKDARRIPLYKTVPRADLKMKKGRSATTEQVLNLTLEILYLLTGEDYIIVKKSGGPTTRNKRLQVVEGICRTLGNVLLTPPHSVASQGDNEQKILDRINKITELLTGEVPIRCQDVTLHFNIEEWDYLKGHKDLYKDILMENHQNIVLPDGPICRNSLFHNVPSDLVNEDDMTMDTESGTESLKVHNTIDMQIISSGIITEKTSGYKNGNLSDAEHKHDSSIHIKEEPCDVSWDGGNLPNMTTRSAVQLNSIHSKEELVSYDGDSLTDPNSYTPTDHSQDHPSPHVLDEQISCGRQNLTQPNFHTSTDPSQYLSAHNIEAPISCDAGHLRISNICTLSDQTQQHPSPSIMEEPASSNKEDLNYTNLPTQYFPIRIKEEPVSYEDHIDNKTCTYPTQQSSSILVKHEGTSSHIGRKLKNTVMEPSVISTISDDPKTDVDNEECSSSVYSVRQSANTVEILYHCPSCHEGFFSNLDLARHQVNHTVDKLFMCSLCGKSFTELSFLVKHQVIHTDLKLCVCPVCGGCFYSETSLAKHQKSHSLPMYCARCGRCFFDKTELEVHMQKHTAERPYACHTCGKQFTSKSLLDRHVLIHTQAEQSK